MNPVASSTRLTLGDLVVAALENATSVTPDARRAARLAALCVGRRIARSSNSGKSRRAPTRR